MTEPSRNMRDILESNPIETSAPCRIDMGGTLDIKTFYLPLRRLEPLTFNAAIRLRTTVKLRPHEPGRIKISSTGFQSAEYSQNAAPFSHPMGLMFAIAAYFNAGGVHIHIDSSSPPRSALGGSSAAAVALVAAFSKLESVLFEKKMELTRSGAALFAHALEESVAGVPCGCQDHLAAAYGGVNAWIWKKMPGNSFFEKRALLENETLAAFEKNILIAYCGIPHESKDVNGQWIRQFLEGKHRAAWVEIATGAKTFADAIEHREIETACQAMNRETALRLEMTPHVLDEMGQTLVSTAMETGCGAKFTGAGGGGCVWALGEPWDIDRLKKKWNNALSGNACILDVGIDSQGLEYADA